jgi:hypothetical protein|nr:hypothetical protein [Calidithermus timidus]
MLDKTIAAFCTIDDLLPLLGHNDDPQTKTPSSVLLTLAILAALHFGGHHQKTLAFAHNLALFSYVPTGDRPPLRKHPGARGLLPRLQAAPVGG